jgi:hypothetical protein
MKSAAFAMRYAEARCEHQTERRYEMTTISHEPSKIAQEKPLWTQLLVVETWASLAIGVMWLAVLFDAIYGPNIVTSTPGGTSSSCPSAVAVALFAFLSTWVVARYAFRRNPEN